MNQYDALIIRNKFIEVNDIFASMVEALMEISAKLEALTIRVEKLEKTKRKNMWRKIVESEKYES